jgi:hypothetical protein
MPIGYSDQLVVFTLESLIWNYKSAIDIIQRILYVLAVIPRYVQTNHIFFTLCGNYSRSSRVARLIINKSGSSLMKGVGFNWPQNSHIVIKGAGTLIANKSILLEVTIISSYNIYV